MQLKITMLGGENPSVIVIAAAGFKKKHEFLPSAVRGLNAVTWQWRINAVCICSGSMESTSLPIVEIWADALKVGARSDPGYPASLPCYIHECVPCIRYFSSSFNHVVWLLNATEIAVLAFSEPPPEASRYQKSGEKHADTIKLPLCGTSRRPELLKAWRISSSYCTDPQKNT